jgi:hypothetical protein
VKTRYLAVAAALAFAGCGFFESSGPEGGVSPFVSDLRVTPSIVPCDRDFILSFDYSDPQGDIESMQVTYRHESGFGFEEPVLWEHGGGFFGLEDLTDEELDKLSEEEREALLELIEDIGFLDLSVPGEATYTTRFRCGSGKPRGAYTVTIILVDDNGHESSPRSDSLRLSSS